MWNQLSTYNGKAKRTDEPKQHAAMSKQSVCIASFTNYPMKCFIVIHKLQHSLKQDQI